jgi:lipoate-protein ligase B
MNRLLDVVDLGHRNYRDVLDVQRTLRDARISGAQPRDMLLLVEHDPVYTLGRGTQAASLPLPAAELRARGADVVEIERGGDVTWHGPGQLVGYPILDLAQHRKDLHWYLRTLEQALIGGLATGGIAAQRNPGKTGVWTHDRKIASIGIHVRQWVTLHGFALNVDPDLAWFDLIVPCGIAGVTMTSVARELDIPGPHDALRETVQDAIIASMAREFALEPRRVLVEEFDHAVPTLLHEGVAPA